MARYKGVIILYACLLLVILTTITFYLYYCYSNTCDCDDHLVHDVRDDVLPPRPGVRTLGDGQSLPNVDALNDYLQSLAKNALEHTVNTTNATILEDLPTIFIVTPTYKRDTQKADMTRLCQTLMHVKNLKWIVVEDNVKKSKLISNFLNNCPVSSVYLREKTSDNFTNVPIKTENGKSYYGIKKPRGIEQRNKAIEWLRKKYNKTGIKGVFYFGDDDNTYDLRIFKEMRNTKKVSVWPVGLAGGLKYEGPKCTKTEVIGWYSYWGIHRKFRIDFSGFAINIELLLNSTHVIPISSKPGYVEDAFLRQFVTVEELEPKANSCKKVYVWHTRTEKPGMYYEKQLEKLGHPSNSDIEV